MSDFIVVRFVENCKKCKKNEINEMFLKKLFGIDQNCKILIQYFDNDVQTYIDLEIDELPNLEVKYIKLIDLQKKRFKSPTFSAISNNIVMLPRENHEYNQQFDFDNAENPLFTNTDDATECKVIIKEKEYKPYPVEVSKCDPICIYSTNYKLPCINPLSKLGKALSFKKPLNRIQRGMFLQQIYDDFVANGRYHIGGETVNVANAILNEYPHLTEGLDYESSKRVWIQSLYNKFSNENYKNHVENPKKKRKGPMYDEMYSSPQYCQLGQSEDDLSLESHLAWMKKANSKIIDNDIEQKKFNVGRNFSIGGQTVVKEGKTASDIVEIYVPCMLKEEQEMKCNSPTLSEVNNSTDTISQENDEQYSDVANTENPLFPNTDYSDCTVMIKEEEKVEKPCPIIEILKPDPICMYSTNYTLPFISPLSKLGKALTFKKPLNRIQRGMFLQQIYDDFVAKGKYHIGGETVNVANAILNEYAHLTEGLDYESSKRIWIQSLYNKFSNENYKNQDETPKKKQKGSICEEMHGIPHYCPLDHPEEDLTLESDIAWMKKAYSSIGNKKDVELIKFRMKRTFSSRRQKIVKEGKTASDIMDIYPCLLMEEQILHEIQLLYGKCFLSVVEDKFDLLYAVIEKHYFISRSKYKQECDTLFEKVSCQQAIRNKWFRLLVYIATLLKERPRDFIWNKKNEDGSPFFYVKEDNEVDFLVDRVILLKNISAKNCIYIWIGSFAIFNIAVPTKNAKTYGFLNKLIFNNSKKRLSQTALKLLGDFNCNL